MKHLMACTALCLILGVTFPAEARWSVLQKDEKGDPLLPCRVPKTP